MEYQESLNPESLSDYELERGKPMPSRNHAIVNELFDPVTNIRLNVEEVFQS